MRRKTSPTRLPQRSAPRLLRCALYTRVSSDAGLEQEFNSLDNQREAAEAYIRSQAHEGWRALPTRYDDGGYSGGSLERPALQRLLADVAAGLIDVVVVYKVDRLTRSLADFAKLVELFDAHAVSFVSVTQAFNTTSSMGRLTLNVLLSFAQFEREVTGERIGDKLAASRRKRLWMGGGVPLGYRVENRRLVVEESEAETVRLIFRRYLELGSLGLLIEELAREGLRTRRVVKGGRERGGCAFRPGPLAYLLKNRTYLGEVVHGAASYPGEHPGMVDPAVFAAVQARLAKQAGAEKVRALAGSAPLLGRLYDDAGQRMTPSHTNKGGVRYRYYVSCVLVARRREEGGSVQRVPAPEIEAAVLEAVRRERGAEARDGLSGEAGDALLWDQVSRVTVHADHLAIELVGQEDEDEPQRCSVAWQRRSLRARRQVIGAETGEGRPQMRPMTAEARARLLQGIARARRWLDQLMRGEVASTAALAEQEGCSERAVRLGLNLAFLSPRLVGAALEGRLPHGVGLTQLTTLPMDWAMQGR